MKLLAVDVSGIYAAAWFSAGNDGDISTARRDLVRRVRAHAQAFDRVVLALDSRTSWRKKLDPSYKSTREEKPAGYYEQQKRGVEELQLDGYVAVEVDGCEADDVIGALCSIPLRPVIQAHDVTS